MLEVASVGVAGVFWVHVMMDKAAVRTVAVVRL